MTRPALVVDTAHFMRTGQRLNLDTPGAWELEGYDGPGNRDVITSEDGPLDLPALRRLRDAYPGVAIWQARPARIDETYSSTALAARRVAELFGVDGHTAAAILTIATDDALGWRYSYGRFEVTADDDDQTFRIRSIDAELIKFTQRLANAAATLP